ncbi:nucleotide-binding universal stress UspA family protein [Rhodopseudomonas faecalis]|uniref:Nucleotide-binding universal stress UspA family protein n=1 Tax=Rhodopseudomonas faecalis TaxID=99655 RepID=A0A318TR66_9BRAD|nr:universal stress protein [Rhodopseudomonas faecalis]PYF04395.1 nucleotide-binding universal stress UspA family protein [Rhodopseudomonas faecalis]
MNVPPGSAMQRSGLQVVVAATDFSARSDRAVRRAAALAKAAGARLVLLHVVDDDQPARIVDGECELAETALADAIREHAYLAGLQCTPIVARGVAFDGIVKVAEQQQADLCVIGSHRRAFLKDIFIGTTAERVIRNSSFPVLMANSDPAEPYASGLAPVELSDCSAQALTTARRLGLLPPKRLTVLHVYDAAAAGMLNYAGVRPSRRNAYLGDALTEAARDLAVFMKTVDLGDIDRTSLVREGSAVAETIIDVVTTTRPDLVVIGTHGRRGVVRLLLSSVAEEVLRCVHNDVLVVPVKDAAPS